GVSGLQAGNLLRHPAPGILPEDSDERSDLLPQAPCGTTGSRGSPIGRMKANTARCILCALKKRLEALPETLNTPPVVVISVPDDASSHDEGDSIAFTATSTDAESGDISAGIVWTSDVDGSLGTG